MQEAYDFRGAKRCVYAERYAQGTNFATLSPEREDASSMMQDLRELLPQTKHDTDKAEILVKLGYPAVAPILSDLIQWLQDYNWSVAHVLGPFLASIGLPLLPEVRRVLETDDNTWKYWILCCLVELSPELGTALRDDLTRLASAPTAGEEAEELHTKAREILESLGGVSPETSP
jgi:hypothetical protein